MASRNDDASSNGHMASPSSAPKREMKVLALGLPRTGSTSIAEALSILGFQNVHHCSKAINRQSDWQILNRAADATFSCLPTYTGIPFTRENWDEIYGSCEATTDAASMFGPELIAAYPEAQVILVERDYDKWFRSVFDSLVPVVWGRVTNFTIQYVEPLIGSVSGTATRKLLLGLFSASTPDEARVNARDTHETHARRIRQLVPPEKLLLYRMGDGWEPLCEFLGKDVPDREFPWLNEAAMLRRIAFDITVQNFVKAAKILLPWAVGVGAATGGAWVLWKKQ